MATIIATSISTVGTIVVAIITLITKNKIEKISDVKSEIRNDIEKNRQEDIQRHKETIKMIKELDKKVDNNDIDVVRRSISAFDNLCRLDKNNNSIQQHQYNTAFKDIDKWIIYHKKYPELNGEINVAIENIKEHYKNAKF